MSISLQWWIWWLCFNHVKWLKNLSPLSMLAILFPLLYLICLFCFLPCQKSTAWPLNPWPTLPSSEIYPIKVVHKDVPNDFSSQLIDNISKHLPNDVSSLLDLPNESINKASDPLTLFHQWKWTKFVTSTMRTSMESRYYLISCLSMWQAYGQNSINVQRKILKLTLQIV